MIHFLFDNIGIFSKGHKNIHEGSRSGIQNLFDTGSEIRD